MRNKTYEVVINHGEGQTRFKTVASNIYAAVGNVVNAEKCPVTAVTIVREITNPNANVAQAFPGGRW